MEIRFCLLEKKVMYYIDRCFRVLSLSNANERPRQEGEEEEEEEKKRKVWNPRLNFFQSKGGGGGACKTLFSSFSLSIV